MPFCLTGCNNSTPPSGSGGGTGANDGGPNGTDGGCSADGGGPACTCPTVEIEVNNTPAANDDLVGLKCEHPAHRAKVSCRIRSTGAGAIRTIVLTNPDGRLRFPDSADTTKTVSLPNDGSWVSFEISGERPSAAIGDAVIEAHCQTATGDLKGSKPVTVFWFDEVKIKVVPGAAYSVAGGRFRPVGGNAVNYSAEARIRPAGVDCTAPQVASLRVGIVQNALTATHSRTWKNPAITWNPGVASGTVAIVPSTRSLVRTLSTASNDSIASVAPLYDQPGKAPDTIDEGSLQSPIGCAGGIAATSNDAVSLTTPPTFGPFDAVDSAGTVVGNVTYGTFDSAAFDDSFRTFTVIFNTVSSELCALRERTWTLRINSRSRGPLKATAAPADAPASVDPITTGTFGNDNINDPAHMTTPPGAGTKRFTK